MPQTSRIFLPDICLKSRENRNAKKQKELNNRADFDKIKTKKPAPKKAARRSFLACGKRLFEHMHHAVEKVLANVSCVSGSVFERTSASADAFADRTGCCTCCNADACCFYAVHCCFCHFTYPPECRCKRKRGKYCFFDFYIQPSYPPSGCDFCRCEMNTA